MRKRTLRKAVSLLLTFVIALGVFMVGAPLKAEAASQYITDIVVTSPTTTSITVSFHYSKDTSDEDSQYLVVKIQSNEAGDYPTPTYSSSYTLFNEDGEDPRGNYSHTFQGLKPDWNYVIQIHGHAFTNEGLTTTTRNYYSDWIGIKTLEPQAPVIDLSLGSITSQGIRLNGELGSTGTGYPYDPLRSTRYQGLEAALTSNGIIVKETWTLDSNDTPNLKYTNPEGANNKQYGPAAWDDYDNAFDNGRLFAGLSGGKPYVAQAYLTNIHGLTGYSPKFYFTPYERVAFDEITVEPTAYKAVVYADIIKDTRDSIKTLNLYAAEWDDDAVDPPYETVKITGQLLGTQQTSDTTLTAAFSFNGLEAGQKYEAMFTYLSDGDRGKSQLFEITTLSAPTEPVILTQDADNILSTKATAHAQITDTGNSRVLAQGFVYSRLDNDPKIEDVVNQNVYQAFVPVVSGQEAPYDITAVLTGLKAESTCYVNSYIVTEFGTVYGEVESFTTLSNPKVTTLDKQTDQTESGITVYGDVESVGNDLRLERGIVYARYINPAELVGGASGVTQVSEGSSSDTGEYSVELSGLLPGTTYKYRAYLKSATGYIVYGEQKHFTTSVEAYDLPAVITNPILVTNTSITDTTAEVSGSFTESAGTTVEETGFVYSSVTSDPLLEDLNTMCIPLSDTDGFFGTELIGLTPNTVYYVKAYAENENGTGYGQVISFKTRGTFLGTQPVFVNGLNVDEVTATTITATLELSDDLNLGKYILWSDTNSEPEFQDGDVSDVSAGILNGFSDTMTIEDLVPDTNYTLRGYTRVPDLILGGFVEQYGVPVVVTTSSREPGLPVISNVRAEDIEASTAAVKFFIDPNGYTVTDLILVWSTDQNNLEPSSPEVGKAVFNPNLSEADNWQIAAHSLKSGTAYYYSVLAKNEAGWVSSPVQNFESLVSPDPAASVDMVTPGVNDAQITVDLEVDGVSNEKAAYLGVIVSDTEQNPTFDTPGVIADSIVPDGAGLYDLLVSGLTPDTIYYARAYVTTSEDMEYYNVYKFTTLPLQPPTIELYGPYNMTASSAYFDVDIKSSVGNELISYGLVFGIAPNPDMTKNILPGPDDPTLGQHSLQLPGLTEGTTYYVRAYITTAEGTTFSEDVAFIPQAPVMEEAPVIATESLPGGTTGTAYSQTLSTTIDTPVTWSIENGNLPDGLTLAEETGEISGTPTAEGLFGFTVKALNAGGTDSKALSIVISKAAPSSGGGGGGGGVIYYTVSISDKMNNGTLSVDKTSAVSGSKVTITLKPDQGYLTDTVKVTDEDGKTVDVTKNNNGTYSFIMPGRDVTVEAAFIKQEPKVAFPFDDVKPGDWFYQNVKYAFEKGLIAGTSANLFSPRLNTSRAMIVTILYRMEGSPGAAGNNPFQDVSAGQWFTDAVVWAADNKIVSGYGDGLFGPDDLITREQLAAILYNYAKYKGYETTAASELDAFADAAKVSPWAKAAMEWAAGEELIYGKGSNDLAPQDTATRAEAAALIQRFIEKIAK